jgi:hypothetical protein
MPTTAIQGLSDGIGAGGQAALESVRIDLVAAAAVEPLGTVHLLPEVLSDLLVQLLLGR